ncbi:DUF305 domain-containing protein [Rhodoluna lacicola]|uniref:DUF305 domain-containing protein n=1 Tax=Rhodoluna lacicola TaxID=529884 RepID=UPI002230A294|nr:DUF305 domain-containing protein [Rhodoluna lacicola]
MKIRRIVSISASMLLAATLLTACTVNVGTSDTRSDSGRMMDHNMMGESSSEFSGQDLMFAQMMIPHHQQAVDIGTLAETRASDPEVQALAAKIKAEQAPEIAQMKTWLSSANAPMEMDHDMGMDGMLDADQMAALANAKGAAFDKLFLEAMIAHHKGAIQMAEMVISSNNAEAAALGKAIIESQTEQINFMESLLAK